MNAATVILILLSLSSHVSAGSGLGKSKAAKGLGKLLPPHRMKGKSSTSGNRASASTVSSEIKITGCDDSRRQQIQDLAVASNKMVTEAKRYLDDLEPTQPNLRYTVWFGAYDKSRHQTVLSNFKSMQNQATSITYHCEICPDDIFDSPPYASLSQDASQINLCPKFWEAPVTVTSQAAKIVQELSRKYLAEQEQKEVSGERIKEIKKLAAEYPGRAVNNAANYMYFAENMPALS